MAASFLGKMFRSQRGAAKVARRRPLQVESLETRQLMATLVGLTIRNELLTFDSAQPGVIATEARVSGVQRGETLIGIDHRPATGELYGVGDKGNLYTLDAYTGRATFKAALVADPTDTTSPFTKLSGGVYGVDFNPAVDRLRVVSSLDQNLRINVDNGFTITDTTLAYAAGDVNANGNPSAAGAAYENPDNDPATGTTLRVIDFQRDALVTQNPANNGTLATVGKLGLNASGYVGFDIGVDGTAYASLHAPSRANGPLSGLYTVNLATGAATLVGRIGKLELLRDVSVALPVQTVYAVTSGNNLIRFHSARPDVLTGKLPIQGLAANETLRGIDFRPATGQLYALGSSGKVYTIDTSTAVATATSTTANLSGASGIDFNPVADRLRLTSASNQNLRVNLDAGAVTIDGTLAFVANDPRFGTDPNIVASAYTNSFAGATATTLYGIDSALDILVRQDPPNAGGLVTVGALGVNANSISSFDIASTGVAFAGLTLEGETTTRWYSISLTTGAATPLGIIAGSEVVPGVAIAPAIVRYAKAAFTAREYEGKATIVVLRSGDTTGAVSAHYNTATSGDSPATAGIDYLAAAGLLTFAPGETSKSFDVTILTDRVREAAEAIDLLLTYPSGGGKATLVAPTQARLVIR